jgi:hypothetical protein
MEKTRQTKKFTGIILSAIDEDVVLPTYKTVYNFISNLF